MREYNAIEAARILGISDKTVRRYIQKGMIHARKQASGQLKITESEVEKLRLILELQDSPVEQADQHRHAADMSRQIEELAAKVAELESRLVRLESSQTSAMSRPPETAADPLSNPQPQKRATIAKSAPSDGDVSIGVFARKHNISDRSFRRYIDHGLNGEKIEAETSRLGRYLTPEQQAAAIDILRRHGVPFTE